MGMTLKGGGMKKCSKCLMPDTKPGLVLDKNGVCQACLHYKLRDSVDYNERFGELRKLTGNAQENHRL